VIVIPVIVLAEATVSVQEAHVPPLAETSVIVVATPNKGTTKFSPAGRSSTTLPVYEKAGGGTTGGVTGFVGVPVPVFCTDKIVETWPVVGTATG
jgi:hypothetical protein